MATTADFKDALPAYGITVNNPHQAAVDQQLHVPFYHRFFIRTYYCLKD